MRAITGTRGQLVLVAVGILALALVIADGAILGSAAVTQSQASDDVLVSQAQIIMTGLQDTNGQITFDGSDLPVETQSGIAVDAAVVSPKAVLAQTTSQPLDPRTLEQLAAQVVRTGQPAWANVTDSHNISRRVYAVALSSGNSPDQTLIVSRSIAEMIERAERMETSCSVERPPKRTPMRVLLM